MSWLVVVCGDLVSPLLELSGLILSTGACLEHFAIGLVGDVDRAIIRLCGYWFVTFLAFNCYASIFCSELLMNFFVPLELASWPEGGLVCILGHSGPSASVLFRVV